LARCTLAGARVAERRGGLVAAGAVPVLLSMLAQDASVTAEHVAVALSMLARHPPNRPQLAPAIEALVGLAGAAVLPVRAAAVGALGNVAIDGE
jgi:hypothetical protein